MSALTKTLKYMGRTIKYLWFIKHYWKEQIIFNTKTFNDIVLNGYTYTTGNEKDQKVLIPVNNYYTRYENTNRAAA
jgi:hypothetical protein